MYMFDVTSYSAVVLFFDSFLIAVFIVFVDGNVTIDIDVVAIISKRYPTHLIVQSQIVP